MNPSIDYSFGPWPWPIEDAAVRFVMEGMIADGSWGRYHGPHCDALRNALAEYHAVEHVHLCSSGTSAVELALRASNVCRGDEVILAAYDYKANFANVLALEARPVLVDTLVGRPVLDPDRLMSALTPSTRAIICSHLHGCMAPIKEIAEFANEHNLTLIEDACQVPGARIDGRRAGSIGHVGVLSFGGSKLLTAGRGGAVLTHDAQLAQRIRLYTQRGNDAYPLSEMQAAVLLPQIQMLDQRNERRQQSVELLLRHMSPKAEIDVIRDGHSNAEATYYKLAFLMADKDPRARDRFLQHMRGFAIPLDNGFPGLHMIHAKTRFRAVGDLPNATAMHNQLLTLHHPVLLGCEDDIRRIANLLSADRFPGIIHSN